MEPYASYPSPSWHGSLTGTGTALALPEVRGPARDEEDRNIRGPDYIRR